MLNVYNFDAFFEDAIGNIVVLEFVGPPGLLDPHEESLRALQERMTYDQLFRLSEPKRVGRSRTVRGPPLEIASSRNDQYHFFNFKSYPSTTGLRHKGYIRFLRPRSNKTTTMDRIQCEVDCQCPDYRYRWAWANKQRGAGRVGAQSLNQALNRAPRITNPKARPGLCKHLLAARNYIYGLLSSFPNDDGTPGAIDARLDQLTRHATNRWINFDSEMTKARERERRYGAARQRRNQAGPQPMAEPREVGQPNPVDQDMPPPLPQEIDPNQQVGQNPNPNPAVRVRGQRWQNPNESSVVNATIGAMKNKIQLNETEQADIRKRLSEAGEDLDAIQADMTDMPPEAAEEEAEEDEVLAILRNLDLNVGRLADKIAPEEHEHGQEGDEASLEEPAVPPVEGEEDDESGAHRPGPSMPLPTGA